MTSVKNIVVASTYQKDGEEKTWYNKIGYLFTKPDGKQGIKITHIPTAWDGWAFLQDPLPPKEQQPEPKQESAVNDFDEIPF